MKPDWECLKYQSSTGVRNTLEIVSKTNKETNKNTKSMTVISIDNLYHLTKKKYVFRHFQK